MNSAAFNFNDENRNSDHVQRRWSAMSVIVNISGIDSLNVDRNFDLFFQIFSPNACLKYSISDGMLAHCLLHQ